LDEKKDGASALKREQGRKEGGKKEGKVVCIVFIAGYVIMWPALCQ
jgi:hypothetical protein